MNKCVIHDMWMNDTCSLAILLLLRLVKEACQRRAGMYANRHCIDDRYLHKESMSANHRYTECVHVLCLCLLTGVRSTIS